MIDEISRWDRDRGITRDCNRTTQIVKLVEEFHSYHRQFAKLECSLITL